MILTLSKGLSQNFLLLHQKEAYTDGTFEIILRTKRTVNGEEVKYAQCLMISIKEVDQNENGRTYVLCRPLFIAFLLGKGKRLIVFETFIKNHCI